MDLTAPFVCFLGSASIAVCCNVPSRAIALCGLLGDVGWFGQIYLQNHWGMSVLASNFLAAFVVALASELAARLLRLPVMCFTVPGVIPLVPGFSVYNAMYGYVTDQFDKANAALIQAVLIAAAISSGLAIASSVVSLLPGQRPWRNPQSPIDDTVAVRPARPPAEDASPPPDSD